MFRAELQTKLRGIFDFKKTTFFSPSDKFEQDTLFIEVQQARCRMSSLEGGRETARVTGDLVVFSQGNKLPYGFFNKRIERAAADLKRGLFFFDVDVDDPESPARLQNIHERRCGFLFLYDGQYDPSRGDLTSLEFGS